MPSPNVRWYLRWRPHVLIFVLVGAGTSWCLLLAAGAFIWAWWAPSYQPVTWTMTEADPNPKGALIRGHLPDETLVMLEADLVGDRVLLRDLPTIAFEPGRQLPLWHSTQAPDVIIQHRSTNNVPVAAMPHRPGWLHVAAWLAAAFALAGCGVRATRWLAAKTAIEAGDRSLKPRPGGTWGT